MEQVKHILEPITEYTSLDVMRFMVHGALYEKSPKNWTMDDRKREMQRERLREVGVVHVTTGKEQLSTGQSIVVSSFETLERLNNHLTHWTPQVYMWGKANNEGRNFENIRFITCVGVEIDKKISLEEIHYAAAVNNLPSPSVILSTPRGLQWFYVFSTPFLTEKGRKAGRFVSEEIKRAFVNVMDANEVEEGTTKPIFELEADLGAYSLGYFRIPREDNILYFNGQALNSEWALAWAKEQSRKHKRPAVANTSSSRMYKKVGIMEDPAIQSIINNVFLRGCKGKLGRNNAVFILSLAMKYEGKTESEIIDKIDEWNSQIKSPLKHTEILRTVRSAMNDKYNAPKKDYVEELAEMRMEFVFDIRTPAKERLDRQQSHYSEWEQDIIEMVEQQCTSDTPYLCGSLRALAQKIGEESPVGKAMNKSSLSDVLKVSKKLIVKTNGKKGRNARTYITTRSVLLKSNKHNFKAFLLGKLAFNEEIESTTLEVQFRGQTSESEANKNSGNKRSGPGG
ncbi:repS protein (plasmid) [Bacillus cereus]|uniref:primase C-terminal domain-containing protein n=1 Tax=Bacillus cereus group TaxID=86661 RepID=UPI000A30109A|nr:primase C-terminal domain-containing protein [Bacillus cereus]HDX9575975.1 primase C-terminal domain-containing protein [Bacillus mobilis]MBL3742411.1 primase C-terminal domain-containing protein [Bacillus cereus]MBL3864447.1 primase C-terminal domain-containing protein [Bacillus cereus]MBL3881366.1 primase C-terminal domain-containing protein [Bacillus cereus]SMD76507.1 hypothetical protein BACERE00184_01312 [Bacillus cereus]